MILKYFLLLLPFIVITIFSRSLLFFTSNPSWGDMVAIPPQPLPFFDSILYVWRDVFGGGFGPMNIPHLLLSQFSHIVTPSLLAGIYLFFIFLLLFISFLDILKQLLKKSAFLDLENLITANLLVLIICFSNTFLANFLQGNPDIYYGYLIGIPAIFYLFLFIRDRELVSGLKMALLITIANLFGSFSAYYLAILMLPFAILFLITYRRKIPFLSLLLVVFLIILSNSWIIFATIKPIFEAVNAVSTTTGGKEIVATAFSLYHAMNPMQLFYFAGNFGDITWLLFNIPGGYLFKNSFLYLASALQFIVLIFLIFKSEDALKTKNGEKRLVMWLFAIFLLFFTLLLVWGTPVAESILKHIPMTALYRNPKKLVLSLFVAYIVVIIFSRLLVKGKTYILALGALLLLNFVPLFSLINDGYLGLKNSYTISYSFYYPDEKLPEENFKKLVSYPDRFLTLKQLLTKEDKVYDPSYRIVILPDNSQSLYQGQLFYLLNPFSINN